MESLEHLRFIFDAIVRALWIVAWGAYYVFIGVQWAKRFTMDAAIVAFVEHPIVGTTALAASILVAVAAGILCFKGLARLAVPLAILVVAGGLFAGIGIAGIALWDASASGKRSSPTR